MNCKCRIVSTPHYFVTCIFLVILNTLCLGPVQRWFIGQSLEALLALPSLALATLDAKAKLGSVGCFTISFTSSSGTLLPVAPKWHGGWLWYGGWNWRIHQEDTNPGNAKGWHHIFRKTQMASQHQLHHPCVIIFLVLSIFQRFEDLSFQIHRISTLLLGQLRWVPDAQEVWMAVCWVCWVHRPCVTPKYMEL